MRQIPQWAQELTLNALEYWESKGNQIPLFDIRWRHGTYIRSSGTAHTITEWHGQTYPRYIVITAGKDRTDAKLVLLHEIAHQLTPDRESHGSTFWGIAWELYRHFKLPIRYCLKRERNYRKGAVVAYYKSK